MLLKEETNIFKGVFSNWIFWVICFLTFFGEILFVELGGKPCRVTPLPLWMHALAFACGSLTWVFCLINKMLPDWVVYVPKWLENGEIDEEDEEGPTIEKQKKSFLTSANKGLDKRTGLASFRASKNKIKA